ncbi:unnamed protein product [Paramecium pentaurelia]|uniref:Uncharacterized protein n=1 Tax=Paramecium pentaurelia TaxID=43138 RepID=A0A8S1VFI0_9CILI|nr:unnamed protein product [Paramecium pentaurelia]
MQNLFRNQTSIFIYTLQEKLNQSTINFAKRQYQSILYVYNILNKKGKSLNQRNTSDQSNILFLYNELLAFTYLVIENKFHIIIDLHKKINYINKKILCNLFNRLFSVKYFYD